MKISAKQSEVLCLSNSQSQCTLQVSGNIPYQDAEKFQHLEMVFTSDRKRNNKVDTRIHKANTVLLELIIPWSQNGSFQNLEAVNF